MYAVHSLYDAKPCCSASDEGLNPHISTNLWQQQQHNKMFVLSEMKDVVQVKPFNFVHNLQSSLEFGLNKKFANKVVHNVG